MSTIGILAGDGKLPIVFAKIAKEKGDKVIAIALKGAADEALEREVDEMHWVEWGDFKKVLWLLVSKRLKKIIMLGKVKKERLFKEADKLDDEAKKIIKAGQGKKDYDILNEVTKVFNKMGVEVLEIGPYLSGLIPDAEGVLTKRKPAEEEKRDIEYGKEVALTLSRYDIGQTIVVKEKTVIAAEAAEGTDETIRRAGTLTGGGFSVIKVARPDQDMRLEVPLVGLETLKTVIEAKGRALALEAKKTLMMNKDEMIRLADDNDISIVII